MFDWWVKVWDRWMFPAEARLASPGVVSPLAQVYGRVFHADGRLVMRQTELCLFQRGLRFVGWNDPMVVLPIGDIMSVAPVDDIHGWPTLPIGATARVTMRDGDEWEFAVESRELLIDRLREAGAQLTAL